VCRGAVGNYKELVSFAVFNYRKFNLKSLQLRTASAIANGHLSAYMMSMQGDNLYRLMYLGV